MSKAWLVITAVVSDAYYGDTETRDNPCTPEVDPANQAGMVKTATSPSAADGSRIVTETVYDTAGRTVATRIGSDPWTCTTYDDRDRPLTVTYPASGSYPQRTVTHDYAVGGDPLTTLVTDPSGSITTTVDLVGRVVSYTDVSGATTTTSYDQAGRATGTSTTIGTATTTTGTSFDDADRVTQIRLDGQVVATPGYTPAGELAT